MNTRSNTRSILSFPSRISNVFGDGPTGGEVLTGLLKTVYNQTDADIAKILADGRPPAEVLTDIKALDVKRVSTLKTQAEDGKYQEGYKKAKGEVLTAHEAEVKTLFGVDSDLKGAELYKHIRDVKLKESGAGGEDDIKRTPTYQAMERDLQAKLKKAQDDGEAKVRELQNDFTKKETLSIASKKALDMVVGMNAIFSSNATVAETQRADFVRDLAAFEYDAKDPENILVLKDGKVQVDAHGHTLKYDQHIKNMAERRFEFKANNGGENAGNNTDPKTTAPAAYPANVTKPKNAAELSKVMATETLKPAEKRVVLNTYNAEYPNG